MLKEIADSDGEVITFIDELHTIVGAGGAEGAVDAGNMIKPMLARGELRLIGATTLDEYRKYIEKDAALERRFQPVFVGEPSVEDTIAILRGLKERYEVHHGVRIQDAALVAAAVLSDRYITGRQLPDKAIDLDRRGRVAACASRSTRCRSRSTWSSGASASSRSSAPRSPRRPTRRASSGSRRSTRSCSRCRKSATAWSRTGRPRRTRSSTIQAGKERLEQARLEAERAERDGDLERAAQLRYGHIPVVERELDAMTQRLDDLQRDGAMLKEEVDEEDVAEIVAKWTGIPVSRLMEGEMAKLVRLEERAARARGRPGRGGRRGRRTRSGVRAPGSPIRTGRSARSCSSARPASARPSSRARSPSSCSTTSARWCASTCRSTWRSTRCRGSSARRRATSATRRAASSPRRCAAGPYAVILLDEIEKAHPDVFNVLLQLMDDGRLTDGQGRTVDFTNTVVIMT